MDSFAHIIGLYLMNLLVNTGVITFISDDYATALGYFILAILIIIILLYLGKSISRVK